MNTRKTVLIVDDVAINRYVLQDFFENKYDTLLAKDGEEAISLLVENAEEIALVLLDIRMPKKNGFDVLQFMKIHHFLEWIPVIVITGSNDYQDELQAYDFGASDIIHKPFVPQVVMRRAENIMELFAHRLNVEKQLELSQRALEDSRSYDTLTGLYNMQCFLLKANEILRAADENNTFSEYTFVYSNIRNFKYYNLNFGNQVLRIMAAKIKELNDEDDINARFSSDHIVFMAKKKNAMDLAQTISKFFEREFEQSGLKLKIGMYSVKEKGENASIACDFAKIACDNIYDSVDGICVYSEKISRKMKISSYVLQHLDEAIENEYIKVYYQPVMRTLTGALCGMEALARWIDPEYGFLSPADFISVLEKNHLISKFDLYMLRIICKDIKEAEKNGLSLIPVSFNLSRNDFLDCDIFAEIEKIIKEYDVPRDMINIEVTESIVMESPDYMKKIIKKFREVGYQVWMDDFGSGYSSLNLLKDFELDEIKLDMKFLDSFDDNSKKIIKAIVVMAKELGIQTLTEGVETEEQLAYLRSVGCEKVQGYFFSKPLPLKEVKGNIDKDNTLVEERGWRNYYNKIGDVNFATDRPLSIVEFNGKQFEYLFINQTFKEVWLSLGIDNLETVYTSTNSVASPLNRQLRDMQLTLHVGDKPQELIYSVSGQYIRLRAECLSEYQDYASYAVEITNLDNKDSDEKREHMDRVLHMMFSLYDSIYLLDVKKGNFRTFVRGVSNNLSDYKEFHDMELINPLKAAKVFIHPSEQEEYIEFCDPTTIIERLKNREKGYITKYFRTLTGDGTYIWKAHILIYIMDGDHIIYCSRKTNFQQPGLLERIFKKES